MNPYHQFVQKFRNLTREAGELPLGAVGAGHRPVIASDDARTALLFSAHPDDECITGALPLRLAAQCEVRVVNVAVTLGSRMDRREQRLAELKAACAFLGFEVVCTAPLGLENINRKGRETDPDGWLTSTETVREIIAARNPDLIVVPHDKDANSTHVGTNMLVFDALRLVGDDFSCTVVETEYWAPMEKPNTMIESSVEDVADLVAATSCHVGEVSRNPCHIGLPAWMQDSVRRGSELIGGQGGRAADFAFATLYRARKWQAGALRDFLPDGLMIPCEVTPARLLD